MPELGAILVWASGVGLVTAGATPLVLRDQAARERVVGWVLALVVLASALAITDRWLTVGHGPFLTLYEVLLSNLFSLSAIFGLAYWRWPALRHGAPFALAALLVIAAWSTTVSPASRPLPATYENPWLWVHVLAGKLFLGCLLVSTSGAFHLAIAPRSAMTGPGVARRRRLVWHFMGAAFVAHSLMLVAGAVWARDAWGRFWAWDPLEVWTLIDWLLLGALLHLNAGGHLHERVRHWLVVACFGLAVMTFLGVPFLSSGVHKGVL